MAAKYNSTTGSSAEPKDGQEMWMYHGTTLTAAKKIKDSGFKPSKGGMLGCGVYLSPDIKKAERYPIGERGDKAVLRVRVNVGKVIKIDRQGHPQQNSWHDHGYDTAWCPPDCGMVKSGLEEYCVWDPKRILVIEMNKIQNVPSSFTEPEDRKEMWMYHGTTLTAAKKIEASGFKPSKGGTLGCGVYLSPDLKKAERYPIGKSGDKAVLRVKVDVGKVIKIDRKDHPQRKNWHDHGYDTAWCPPDGMVKSGREEFCVWDPKRILVIEIFKTKKSSEVQHVPSSSDYVQVLALPGPSGIIFIDPMELVRQYLQHQRELFDSYCRQMNVRWV